MQLYGNVLERRGLGDLAKLLQLALRGWISRRDDNRDVHTIRRKRLSIGSGLPRHLPHRSTVVEMRVELADDLVDSLQFFYECGVIENLALPKGQPLAQLRRGLVRQALDIDVQRAGNIGEDVA